MEAEKLAAEQDRHQIEEDKLAVENIRYGVVGKLRLLCVRKGCEMRETLGLGITSM